MLRPCRQNPRLSAYESMEVAFHFYATPMAPPGEKDYVNEKREGRSAWGFNAKNAWYIVPATKNCICFKVAMVSMAAYRVSDTIQFDHHDVSIPAFTSEDIFFAEMKHLTDAIWKQPPTASPEELAAVH